MLLTAKNCNHTVDAQLRWRDMKGFCDNPYPYLSLPPPPQMINSLDRKTSECDADTEVSCPKLMVSDGDVGGEGLSSA